MSFEKGKQLLQLALMTASRSQGISLREIGQEFEVSYRTAQRMIEALQSVFPDLAEIASEEGRKRWALRAAGLRQIAAVQSDEVTALDSAIRMLNTQGLRVEAERLSQVREKVRAFLVPRSGQARFETDYEALLEAQGFVARPGPKPIADAATMEVVTEAIKACRVLELDYRSRGDPGARSRRIAPYGILTGLRRYVVAQTVEAGAVEAGPVEAGPVEAGPVGPIRLFRFEAIANARPTESSFTRPGGFNLQDFAKRAFGVFQRDDEYGEIVWKFTAKAAAQARSFEFHPNQVQQELADGSLLVRFRAAGHLEMCWHLYAWGDNVEVLGPPALRAMCEGFRRSDFPAMP